MTQTIGKHIGEGFGKGELYAALAYDSGDTFGGMAIKQVRFNPASGSTAITIGDSTTSITLASYAQRAISIYTTCASTDGSNNVLPVYINATMSGTGGVGRAMEAKLTVSGKLGGWGNAIKGYTDVTLTSAATTGLISAVCAELKLPSATLAGGAYACLELEWVGQANTNTIGSLTGAHTTLIYASVGGGTATDFDSNGYILEIEGMTAGSGKAYYNETLRIGIGDNIRYLPLSTAQGTYTTAYPIISTYSSDSAFLATITDTAGGKYGFRALHTLSSTAAVACRAISGEVTYTPSTAATGGSVPIGVAGKVTLSAGCTSTLYMWGIQGQLHLSNTSVLACSYVAAIRAVLTADATPTLTSGGISLIYVDNLCKYDMTGMDSSLVRIANNGDAANALWDDVFRIDCPGTTNFLDFSSGNQTFISAFEGTAHGGTIKKIKCAIEGVTYYLLASTTPA